MKVKDAIQMLSELPEDFNLVFSKVMLVQDEPESNGEEDLVAIVDMPVIGVAVNPSDDEVRFCLSIPSGMSREDMISFYGEPNNSKVTFLDEMNDTNKGTIN